MLKVLKRVILKVKEGVDFKRAYMEKHEDIENIAEFIDNRRAIRHYLKKLASFVYNIPL